MANVDWSVQGALDCEERAGDAAEGNVCTTRCFYAFSTFDFMG